MQKIKKFFGLTRDTIDQRSYFLANATVLIVAFLSLTIYDHYSNDLSSAMLLMNVLSPLFSLSWVVIVGARGNLFGAALLILVAVVLILQWWVVLGSAARRIRDIRISRYWRALILIPGINLFFFLFLCIKKGKEYPYPDNSDSQKIGS